MYRSYYPHRSRELVSPVCGIFFQFCHLRRLVFDQSSPVHPISESRGGSTSVTKNGERRTDERKYLCLIQDFGGLFLELPASQSTYLCDGPDPASLPLIRLQQRGFSLLHHEVSCGNQLRTDAQCTDLQTVPFEKHSNISVVIVFITHKILKKSMKHIIFSLYISADISNYISVPIMRFLCAGIGANIIECSYQYGIIANISTSLAIPNISAYTISQFIFPP